MGPPIGNDVFHGQHMNITAPGKFDHLGQFGHGSVGVGQFAENAEGFKACQPHQVNGGLGMPGPFQDPSLFCL